MGEGKELFSNLLYLSCLKLKRIHMPKWHTFGSHILLPFIRKSHQLASLANSFLFFSCSRRSLTSKTFTTKLKPDFFFSTGFLLRITFKYFVGYFFLALLKCLVLRDHFKIVFCFVRMSCLLLLIFYPSTAYWFYLFSLIHLVNPCWFKTCRCSCSTWRYHACILCSRTCKSTMKGLKRILAVFTSQAPEPESLGWNRCSLWP